MTEEMDQEDRLPDQELAYAASLVTAALQQSGSEVVAIVRCRKCLATMSIQLGQMLPVKWVEQSAVGCVVRTDIGKVSIEIDPDRRSWDRRSDKRVELIGSEVIDKPFGPWFWRPSWCRGQYCEACAPEHSRQIAAASKALCSRHRRDWTCEACGAEHEMPMVACTECGFFSPPWMQPIALRMFAEYEVNDEVPRPFRKLKPTETPSADPGMTEDKSYWYCAPCRQRLRSMGRCKKCGAAGTFVLGRRDGAAEQNLLRAG